MRVDPRRQATFYVANGKGLIVARPTATGPNPLARSAGRPSASTSAGCSTGRCRSSRCPAPSRWPRYTQDRLRVQPAAEADHRRVGKPRARRTIRFPRRSASRARSSTASTSSRRTAPTTRSSATCPRATATRSLCLFPEKVTPNHHALAREFVLLDNFYVESEVSADGHEWTMGAYATDFVEKTWPLGYAAATRQVPLSQPKAAFAIARPAGGYLWDRCAEARRQLPQLRRVHQERQDARRPGNGRGQGARRALRPEVPQLRPGLSRRRSGPSGSSRNWPGSRRRARCPACIVLRLPNDHTSGTAPGKPTPTAMVADNDLALGQVVEGLSKSRFWKETGHLRGRGRRPERLGPRRRPPHGGPGDQPLHQAASVDSTMYSHLVDAADDGADPGPGADEPVRRRRPADVQPRSRPKPDLTPYVHRPAKVDLNAKNPADAWGAEALRAARPLRTRTRRRPLFNEIIWGRPRARFPHAAARPGGVRHPDEEDEDDDEDDDEDEDDEDDDREREAKEQDCLDNN